MSVLRAGLGNPVNMEIVDTVARRNIASLVETSTPAWEGGPTLWHGAKSDFATFDVSLADETALYGPGIYSTANPQMATTYTVSRGWEPMPNQYLHNVQWTGSEPPKIIDVEAPLPPDVREALKPFESVRIVDEQPTPPAGVDPLVYTSIDLGLDQPETTWQKVWDLIGQRSSSNPALYNTMFQGWQERRLGIAQLLVDLGYDAMTHTGGIRTAGIAVGAPEHQVYVWFDDANVISGGRAKTTGFTPQVGDMISGVPGRSLEEAARAKTEHLGSDWENLTDMELYNLVVPSGEIPGLGPGYQGPPGPGGMTWQQTYQSRQLPLKMLLHSHWAEPFSLFDASCPPTPLRLSPMIFRCRHRGELTRLQKPMRWLCSTGSQGGRFRIRLHLILPQQKQPVRLCSISGSNMRRLVGLRR